MDSDLEIVSHSAAIADPAIADTPDDAVVAPKRRAPRKPTKPDALLADAVDLARRGVQEIAEAGQIGDHVGAYPDAERVVTHRFVAHLPGYGGWHWFATLARVPRGKEATVSEVGLLPSETSLLSPPWVPWAERVRPEDSATEDTAPEGSVTESAAAADTAAADTGAEDTGTEASTEDTVTETSTDSGSAARHATGGE